MINVLKVRRKRLKMTEIDNNDPQLSVEKMSVAEFKATITRKGWLMKDVALSNACLAEQLSAVSHDIYHAIQ